MLLENDTQINMQNNLYYYKKSTHPTILCGILRSQLRFDRKVFSAIQGFLQNRVFYKTGFSIKQGFQLTRRAFCWRKIGPNWKTVRQKELNLRTAVHSTNKHLGDLNQQL